MTTDFNTVISEATQKKNTEKKSENLELLVVFGLDKEEYAVPIGDLREIIRIPEIAPVPNAPDFIRGIFNLRGTIVVVIDLERKFHIVREDNSVASHIVITEINGSTFGIMVDKVSEVLRVSESKIQQVPSLIASKINIDYLKGVAVLEEETVSDANEIGEDKKSRLIIILDLPKMLAEEELLRVDSSMMIGMH